MATANLGMTVPTVGADADVWGNSLNADLALLDAAFSPNRSILINSTPVGTLSATAVMMGLGTAITLTPSKLGKGRIKIWGYVNTLGTATPVVTVRYGTGTAPANGVAVTGSAFSVASMKFDTTQASNIPFHIEDEVTALSLATAYWADLALIAGSAGVVSIVVYRAVFEEFYV